MATIKNIETYYNGYHFRSRLEARWAVFLDALGVDYEYEPEGFDLGNGKCYLPDFRVKCWGKRGERSGEPFDLYIEVKGEMNEKDADKIRCFSGIGSTFVNGWWVTSVEHPTLIVGNIPAHGAYGDSSSMKAYEKMNGCEIYPFNYELIDGDYFGAYPAADAYGHFYLFGDDSNYINRDDIPRVINAYDAARMARFEHGETPKFN